MYTQNNVFTISDMRMSPKKILKQAEEGTVYVFYKSKPKVVVMSTERYWQISSMLEDYMLALKSEEYEKEDKSKIKWLTLDEILDN